MNNSATRLLILSLVLLGACGGDSEPTDQTSSGVDSGSQTQASQNNQQPLTGRIITVVEDRKPIEFDLATGKRREITTFDLEGHFIDRGQGNPERDGVRSFVASETGGGPVRYVETTARCIDDTQWWSCYSVLDEQFQPISVVSMANVPVNRELKLSRSGLYLLLSQHRYSREESWTRMAILAADDGSPVDVVTPDLSIASRDSSLNRRPAIMEWGLDDRIIYTLPGDVRPTVYVTEPASMQVARTITLPSNYNGEIISLDLHPDGNQLLFQYMTRGAENDEFSSIIIALDLTTLNLRFPVLQEVDADRNPIGDKFSSYFQIPRWSPDGDQILFWAYFSAGFLGTTSTIFNGPNVLLVIPGDSDRLIINQFADSFSPPVVVVKLEKEDGSFTNKWINGRGLSWVR